MTTGAERLSPPVSTDSGVLHDEIKGRRQKRLVKRAVFQPYSPARDALVVELVDTQP